MKPTLEKMVDKPIISEIILAMDEIIRQKVKDNLDLNLDVTEETHQDNYQRLIERHPTVKDVLTIDLYKTIYSSRKGTYGSTTPYYERGRINFTIHNAHAFFNEFLNFYPKLFITLEHILGITFETRLGLEEVVLSLEYNRIRMKRRDYFETICKVLEIFDEVKLGSVVPEIDDCYADVKRGPVWY